MNSFLRVLKEDFGDAPFAVLWVVILTMFVAVGFLLFLVGGMLYAIYSNWGTFWPFALGIIMLLCSTAYVTYAIRRMSLE